MDFPITDLLDDANAEQWVERHFHPNGLTCPGCQAPRAQAHRFRQTKRSRVTVYRCARCRRTYSAYTGTLFAAKHLRPAQVVLLLRGVCKGETTAALARELELTWKTTHHLRKLLQAQAVRLQPDTPLRDAQTETDEMFQNAGEKRGPARRPR